MAAAQVAPVTQSVAVPQWGLVTRIAFRLCFVYFGLYCLLTQILSGLIQIPNWDMPDPGTVGPMPAMISWAASHVFRAKLPLVFTGSGSGDKTYDFVLAFCLLVLAVVTTAVWTVLDRNRGNYVALNKWFRLFLRFAFAGQMLAYGMVKAVPLQMPFPYLMRLLEPFGNFSPMGVLWAAVGASPAYERFTGCAEILGGLLLMVPATAVLGALLCLVDVTFIFVLNMTYDVPVKLFSFHLILMSLFLLAPEFRRLWEFFVGNRAVAASSQPALFATKRRNSIALAAQIVFGVYLVAMNAYGAWTAWDKYGGGRPKSPLYGIWSVDEVSVDGQVRPPLLSDTGRLHRAVFDFPEMVVLQNMDDSFGYYGAAINEKDKTINLTKRSDNKWKAHFTFQRSAAHELNLDGTMDNHKTQMKLRLADNKFMLLTRGFHWIQEYPFNR